MKGTSSENHGDRQGDPRQRKRRHADRGVAGRDGKYNEELIKAGIMQGGGGLKPTSLGKRVRFSGAQRAVVNGPFAPTEEQAAGYWIWEVTSLDEAVEWLKRCPNPMPVDSEIEIRPEYEAADFAG